MDFKDWQEQIRMLQKNKEAGSTYILNSLIDSLSNFLASIQEENVNLNTSEIKDTLKSLIKKHNQFLVLMHFIEEFFHELEKTNHSEKLHFFIEDYKSKWNNIEKNIGENLISIVGTKKKSVLLHSNSSSVCNVLKFLKKKNLELDIFQTESRPVNEGRKQAEFLIESGFHVTLLVDTGISKIINNIDLCLLGTDAVFEDHFINKIGSYQICLLCHEFNVPVFVLADSRKIISMNKEIKWPDEEPKSPEEVWKNPDVDISIVNYYFEKIPRLLISKFITEKKL